MADTSELVPMHIQNANHRSFTTNNESNKYAQAYSEENGDLLGLNNTFYVYPYKLDEDLDSDEENSSNMKMKPIVEASTRSSEEQSCKVTPLNLDDLLLLYDQIKDLQVRNQY